MSFSPQGLERLRQELLSRGGGDAPAVGCADPQRIWAAVVGRERPADLDALLAHCVRCPECQLAWSLARSIAAASGQLPAAGGATLARRWPIAAALAAGVAALALWPLTARWRPQAPVELRTDPGEAIAALSAPALPREQALLRWTPLPAGARYSVQVALPDLTPVHQRDGLTRAEEQIPPAALLPLPAGAELIWRVEARLPDGRRLDSPAFRLRLR
jgi:hypothetical protein